MVTGPDHFAYHQIEMLKRWIKLLLASWIALVQAMAPFVHAHVGGQDGGDQFISSGIHLHIAPGYEKSPSPGHQGFTATPTPLGDAAMAIGIAQGIGEALAKIPHGKNKSPADDAIPVSLLALPRAILTHHGIEALPSTPFVDHHTSPRAARAPPSAQPHHQVHCC